MDAGQLIRQAYLLKSCYGCCIVSLGGVLHLPGNPLLKISHLSTGANGSSQQRVVTGQDMGLFNGHSVAGHCQRRESGTTWRQGVGDAGGGGITEPHEGLC